MRNKSWTCVSFNKSQCSPSARLVSKSTENPGRRPTSCACAATRGGEKISDCARSSCFPQHGAEALCLLAKMHVFTSGRSGGLATGQPRLACQVLLVPPFLLLIMPSPPPFQTTWEDGRRARNAGVKPRSWRKFPRWPHSRCSLRIRCSFLISFAQQLTTCARNLRAQNLTVRARNIQSRNATNALLP